MMITSISPKPRLFFLDWLRIAAFALLVVYHVGMYYVSWRFHVKSPYADKALDTWMMLSSPWRMSVIFLIAGAASAYMLRNHTNMATLRRRTRFLLLPLLVGVIFVIPPQTYFEVVHKFQYQGSFFEFLGLYFGRSKAFCEVGKCLVMPTWNHLWFLPYLWLYTFLLWLVMRVGPSALGSFARQLTIAWIAGLPIALLLLFRFTLFDRFPHTYDVIHDWFSHAQYLLMFFLGALFAQGGGIWERIAAKRQMFLIIALASWAAFVFTFHSSPSWAKHCYLVSQQWYAVLAAVGYAAQYWNGDHPWRARLTEAVFPFYIFHQTWIILLTQGLLPLDLKPSVEGPLIIAATFVLSAASYLAVRKIRWVQLCFGVPPRQKSRCM
jgi:glucans biosynthesis protein C